MRTFLAATLVALLTSVAVAELPTGYWPADKTQPILDSTMRLTLDPDLSHLSKAESSAVDELLAAGAIIHKLYENQRHEQAHDSKLALVELHRKSGETAATQNLLDLFYLSKGPIATTLDNQRLAFVPVDAEHPGKNIYPAGLQRGEIDAYLDAHPTQANEILSLRSVVRRASAENIAADLAWLDDFPEIDALHIGLRTRLESLSEDASAFYAVPYALAYAAELRRVRQHLNTAADHVAMETPDFAAYLRNRGRDLLSGDYESGDASWVSGDFGNLNIQIGSYETYDDSLLGVKATYAASILARDEEKSRSLMDALAGLQAIENSLPYDHAKQVSSRIPVGVYNIIADFGQSRGANTATILPNDADFTRKYGRTILLRYNIMAHPAIFANRKKSFDAVIDACCNDHLTSEGGFNRTLWHEVGHYLGVAKTADGQNLSEALADTADLFEEMKSDLVSLYAIQALHSSGFHDDDTARAHYADGIRRTLQSVKPRPSQAYQTMQLMQFNFYMEYGLLEPGTESGLLVINYNRYHEIVTRLLRQVLQIQYAGDYEQAREFVARWSYWNDKVHGDIAERLNGAGGYRRTLIRYSALND
ncbi:MAG: NUDIX hydrolase [Gammaproteobacteria bacterium]|nr:NUDIX hydrolase [Gammaproteobacteria bacterium]